MNKKKKQKNSEGEEGIKTRRVRSYENDAGEEED